MGDVEASVTEISLRLTECTEEMKNVGKAVWALVHVTHLAKVEPECLVCQENTQAEAR